MTPQERLVFDQGIKFACQQIQELLRADRELRRRKHWPPNDTAVLAFIWGQLNRMKGGAPFGTLKPLRS